MTEGESWYVLDSNIQLRLGIQRHADFPQVRSALDELEARQTPIAYTLQNMTQFWNVATRLTDRNGFGLTNQETDTDNSNRHLTCCRITSTFTTNGGSWLQCAAYQLSRPFS